MQGRTVAKGVTTGRNQFLTQKFPARVDDEALSIQIVAADAKANFALAGVTIRGPKQRRQHSVLSPPIKAIPTLEEIRACGRPDPRQALRAYCDWILTHRSADGTLDGMLTASSHEWYRSSYPLRTLLAGYQIFGYKPYLEAACKLLDRFVNEQLPNGAWSPGFLKQPVALCSRAEIERVMSDTTNTADIGSMTTCLAAAWPLVDPQRKDRYLKALTRYCDDYASRWQLSSGGFTNGRWHGRDVTVPYSVATGTQGMSFCALYAVSGERRYLKIAERAAAFLLNNWGPDGRPISHDYERPIFGFENSTDFGNLYYYHEAILWVWHWTKDQTLKDEIRRVYRWHTMGSRGLLAERVHGVWWPLAGSWANSKAAAMPLVLLEYERSMAADAEVREAVRRAAVFLCHPDFAARLGILVDPELPWNQFGMTATGFGGLFLAELVRPGVIYLRGAP